MEGIGERYLETISVRRKEVKGWRGLTVVEVCLLRSSGFKVSGRGSSCAVAWLCLLPCHSCVQTASRQLKQVLNVAEGVFDGVKPTRIFLGIVVHCLL